MPTVRGLPPLPHAAWSRIANASEIRRRSSAHRLRGAGLGLLWCWPASLRYSLAGIEGVLCSENPDAAEGQVAPLGFRQSCLTQADDLPADDDRPYVAQRGNVLDRICGDRDHIRLVAHGDLTEPSSEPQKIGWCQCCSLYALQRC